MRDPETHDVIAVRPAGPYVEPAEVKEQIPAKARWSQAERFTGPFETLQQTLDAASTR